MAAGYGFESYGNVTKSEPANSVGARLMVQAQAIGPQGPQGQQPLFDNTVQSFGPLPSQSSGNPLSRPELQGGDSSIAVAVGQLLSRTGGGAGKNRPLLPANSTQDETLLNAGFSPEELQLYKEMGGIK